MAKSRRARQQIRKIKPSAYVPATLAKNEFSQQLLDLVGQNASPVVLYEAKIELAYQQAEARAKIVMLEELERSIRAQKVRVTPPALKRG